MINNFEGTPGPEKEISIEAKFYKARVDFASEINIIMQSYNKDGINASPDEEKEVASLIDYLDQGSYDKELYEEIKGSPRPAQYAHIIDDVSGMLLDKDKIKIEKNNDIIFNLIMANRDYEVAVYGEEYAGENSDYYDFKMALEKLRANYIALSKIGELPEDKEERSIHLTRLLASVLVNEFNYYQQEVPKEIKLLAYKDREENYYFDEDDELEVKANEAVDKALKQYKEESLDSLVKGGAHPRIAEKRVQNDIDRKTNLIEESYYSSPGIKESTKYLLDNYPGLKGFIDKLLADNFKDKK